jgi:hypothetical protein
LAFVQGWVLWLYRDRRKLSVSLCVFSPLPGLPLSAARCRYGPQELLNVSRQLRSPSGFPSALIQRYHTLKVHRAGSEHHSAHETPGTYAAYCTRVLRHQTNGTVCTRLISVTCSAALVTDFSSASGGDVPALSHSLQDGGWLTVLLCMHTGYIARSIRDVLGARRGTRKDSTAARRHCSSKGISIAS